MSEIINKLFENLEKPKFLVELRETLTSLEEVEMALIQRYSFSDDGGINVREQLFILECMDAIKELTKDD